MLIEITTRKQITKVPFPERFRLLQRLTPQELEAIDRRINESIDAAGGDIATAGWLPGSDWTGTPFDPIYQKAPPEVPGTYPARIRGHSAATRASVSTGRSRKRSGGSGTWHG